MKATKKILSLVLALMMVLSCVSVLAEPAECTHPDYRVEEKKATCTEDGYTRKICNNEACKKVFDEKVLTKLGHDLKPEITAATCTSNEIKTTTCSRCDYKKVEETPNSMVAHTPGDPEDPEHKSKPATCKEDGYEFGVIKCTVCGLGLGGVDQKIDKLTHEWDKYFTYNDKDECTGIVEDLTTAGDGLASSLKGKIVPAECGKEGSATVTCSVCGEHVTKTLPALEHNWEISKDEDGNDRVVAATCTTKGYEVQECSICGATRTTEIATLGHHVYDFKDAAKTTYYVNGKRVASKPADCVDYVMVTTCQNCSEADAKESKEVAHTKDHVYNETPTVNGPKLVTCTEDGEGLFKCKNCDHYETRIVKATGHVKNEATKVTTPATCTEAGKNVYDCAECKAKGVVTEVIPAAGHKVVTETKEHTKGVDGYEKKYCSICKEVLSNKVIKHVWDKKDYLEIKESSCTTAGYVKYKCSVKDCGEIYTEELPLQDHQYTVDATYQEQACEQVKIVGKKCAVCDQFDPKSLKEEGKPGEHNPSTVNVHTVPADCENAGYTEYNCTICGKYFKDPIEPTGHDYEVSVDAKGNYILHCTNENCPNPDAKIENVPAKYEISLAKVTTGSTTAGTGEVKLIDGNPVGDLHARVYWTYELSNGDVASIVQCRPVNMDTMTFKMNGPRVTGGKLTSVQVHLVTDEDADLSPSFDYLAMAKK